LSSSPAEVQFHLRHLLKLEYQWQCRYDDTFNVTENKNETKEKKPVLYNIKRKKGQRLFRVLGYVLLGIVFTALFFVIFFFLISIETLKSLCVGLRIELREQRSCAINLNKNMATTIHKFHVRQPSNKIQRAAYHMLSYTSKQLDFRKISVAEQQSNKGRPAVRDETHVYT